MAATIVRIFLAVSYALWWFAWPIDAQTENSLWYSYDLDGIQVGYARVSYTTGEDACHKKKFKFRKTAGETVAEDCSAVLNKDYTLRSAYLSQQAQQQQFWVITVADGTVIQTGDRVVTLPAGAFYLEVEDFLRATVIQRPSRGKPYAGTILATDRTSLSAVNAHYLGQTQICVNFQSYRAHQFKVKTDELKDFWAMAFLDETGTLLGYQLGKFSVFAVPECHALKIQRQREPLPAPVIFDAHRFAELHLKISAAHAAIFPESAHQTVRDEYVVLSARPQPAEVSVERIAREKSEYLKAVHGISLVHPLIVKYAPQARKGGSNSVSISRNISQWVYRHLLVERSPAGQELRAAFGMSSDTPALVASLLCRANGIPARVVAGMVYAPGKLACESWAEAYLGEWYPLYRGKIEVGARFLAIYPDSLWCERERVPDVDVAVVEVVKNQKRLRMDSRSTYMDEEGAKVADWLLGISYTAPKDWKAAAKNMWSDSSLFQSESGDIMLLKVFQTPKPLAEVLGPLQERMSEHGKLEILWQQPRVFPGGEGLEVAVKSPSSQFFYRAFVAERENKGVLLLLIVSEANMVKEEKGFQGLISSLRFLVD